jgi:hypothetical protein
MVNREHLAHGAEPMSGRFLLVAGYAGLGSHIAWAAHFNLSYFLVQPVCQTGGVFALHAAGFVALLAALGSLLMAVRILKRHPAPWSENVEGLEGWRAFIGLFGIGSGVLFSVAIIAQWTPVFLVDACA